MALFASASGICGPLPDCSQTHSRTSTGVPTRRIWRPKQMRSPLNACISLRAVSVFPHLWSYHPFWRNE
eukprot:5449275-Pyramimonas_sp.AAC.1